MADAPWVVDPQKIAEDTAINPVDLNNAMIQQASLYTFYGVRHAQADHQYGRQKMLVEIYEAQADKQIREEASAAGTKLTEAQIAKEIARHPEVVKARAKLLEIKLHRDTLGAAVDALKHKKDMLIQLGLQAREEMKGDLAIRTRQATGEERRQQASAYVSGALPQNAG